MTFWQALKKIGLIIAVLAGFVKIYEFATVPRASLAAVAHYERYESPPLLEKSYLKEDYDYGRIRAIWFVGVVNNGKLPLTSIRLEIPGTIVATVWTEHDGKNMQRNTEMLEIGDLRPEGLASIVAWTSETPHEKYDFQARKLRIAHASGTGSVIVRERVGFLWETLAKYWWLVLMFMFWGVAVVGEAAKRKN